MLPSLPPERLEILKRTMPYHKRVARPVDYFEHRPTRVWLVTDHQQSTRRDVIGLFNWNDSQQEFDYPIEYVGLDPAREYASYDFWDSKLGPTLKDRLQVAVPAQSCLVLAVRAKADHPQVLSTSRHVTQGMMDLSEEGWEPSTKTLSGRSKIIRGDTYEVRIASASAPSRITLDPVQGSRCDSHVGCGWRVAETEDNISKESERYLDRAVSVAGPGTRKHRSRDRARIWCEELSEMG